MKTYKLTWEMVSPYKYQSLYTNERPNTPKDQVPEDHWHEVQTETDDPWDQYKTLKLWAEGGAEYIRNVHLYELVSTPEWKEVNESTTK